jgi:Zn-dependent M28 family amino/carboxypeptidase
MLPAESAATAEGFTLAPDPKPEENFFVRSDQYSFVRKGIPALYLDVGTRSKDPHVDADALYEDHMQNHYHEPSDDLSRPVDWDSARRFARANARVGYTLATEAGRPRWNEGDFFGERFASP